jgi:hypothetical protein
VNSKTVTSSPRYKILVGLAATRLYNIAQGFSPGLRSAQFALKASPTRYAGAIRRGHQYSSTPTLHPPGIEDEDDDEDENEAPQEWRPRRVLRCDCVLIPPPPQHRVPLFLLRPIFPELRRTGRAPFYESRDPGLKPISANLAEALRNWVGFLSRRDFTIVARYEVPGIGKKIGPRPGGTVEIGLRAKLCVPNFTPAPNQASLRDAALLRMPSRQ